MVDALLVSSILLWITVVVLTVLIFALMRQVGVLFERVAPLGALTIDNGPAVGDQAPQFSLTSISEKLVDIAIGGNKSQLIFFLSSTCPVCKQLIPVVKSIQRSEENWLSVIYASDGEKLEHRELASKLGLTEDRYVLSKELGMRYRISKLPYAVLIDEKGLVRAKGLVNSREQIESLFTAKEMGVKSVQEFVSGNHSHGLSS